MSAAPRAGLDQVAGWPVGPGRGGRRSASTRGRVGGRRRGRSRRWATAGAVDAPVPVGLGDQAGHRPGRAGGRGGGDACPWTTPAGPPGSTVRHLLAHTSGLGPEGGPALAAPGHRRIYSNAGYRVLADLLADRAGLPFGEYLAEGVLGPAGHVRAPPSTPMPRAGRPPPAWSARWSTWSPWPRSGPGPPWSPPATHRIGRLGAVPGHRRGPARVRALRPVRLGPGRGDPRSQTAPLDGNGQLGGHLRPLRAQRRPSGGWTREAGVACVGLGDRPFGPWAARAWPALADAVLAGVAGCRPLR